MFGFEMNPLLREVQAFLQIDRGSVNTSLVFGLQLLADTFKSHLWATHTSSKMNCRAKALQFANRVKRSIESVSRDPTLRCFRSDCGEKKIPERLLVLEHDLSAYTSETRFDLYYQTPWVAGSHMLEILSWATDVGLSLCNRHTYVGAVFHVYNVLRELSTLHEEVALLERLCNTMEQPIFLGQRPHRNFHGCFCRFLGGRLEFDKQERLHDRESLQPKSQRFRKPKCSMKLPNHVEQEVNQREGFYQMIIRCFTGSTMDATRSTQKLGPRFTEAK
jgi:hypothetical protein